MNEETKLGYSYSKFLANFSMKMKEIYTKIKILHNYIY